MEVGLINNPSPKYLVQLDHNLIYSKSRQIKKSKTMEKQIAFGHQLSLFRFTKDFYHKSLLCNYNEIPLIPKSKSISSTLLCLVFFRLLFLGGANHNKKKKNTRSFFFNYNEICLSNPPKQHFYVL